jgi:hypothetical protein
MANKQQAYKEIEYWKQQCYAGRITRDQYERYYDQICRKYGI